jgi:hypothetical protein
MEGVAMNKKKLRELDVNLRQFIRTYIPSHWKDPIGSIDFVPHFNNDELEIIAQGKQDFKREFKWYILEAIEKFQQKETI